MLSIFFKILIFIKILQLFTNFLIATWYIFLKNKSIADAAFHSPHGNLKQNQIQPKVEFD
jgi:hypothetical protein